MGAWVVFDPETRRFLRSGCALIVATVSSDGEPHAGRAWGLDLVSEEPQPRVRLLLDVDDVTTIEHAAGRGEIAITATSVRTLHSTQLKGRSLGVEVATTGDAERAGRYIEEFFADIHETDGTDPGLLARFEPAGYVACIVEVRERFHQTPGPGAGARIEATEP